jgi:hypothetical protein
MTYLTHAVDGYCLVILVLFDTYDRTDNHTVCLITVCFWHLKEAIILTAWSPLAL